MTGDAARRSLAARVGARLPPLPRELLPHQLLPHQLLPPELHRTQRPSRTAQWTTLSRALELARPSGQRIVTDRYAAKFLTRTNRLLLDRLSGATPAVQLAERSELTAIGTSALCRHRFIDAQLLAALPEVEQVMILGAGYDSRAYRFARAIDGRPVFEVDLAPTSRRKAAIVAADPAGFGRRHGGPVLRVETDFRTQPLSERLAGAGFLTGAPTFVVWEGVSMYLDRAAVEATLQTLRQVCGAGSVLAMDLWRRVPGLGPLDQLRRVAVGSLRLIGEPIRFATPPSSAGPLLGGAGFAVVDLMTAPRMTKAFATAGRHCDEGMYVLAARLP